MKGQYSPNTKSQATDEGPNILRTPRARPPMKGHYSPNTKIQTTNEGPNILRTPRARPPIKGQCSPNFKSQTTNEGPDILRTPRARSPMKDQYSPNTKTEFSRATRRKVSFMIEACEIVNPARKLVSLLYVDLTVFLDAFHLSLN